MDNNIDLYKNYGVCSIRAIKYKTTSIIGICLIGILILILKQKIDSAYEFYILYGGATTAFEGLVNRFVSSLPLIIIIIVACSFSSKYYDLYFEELNNNRLYGLVKSGATIVKGKLPVKTFRNKKYYPILGEINNQDKVYYITKKSYESLNLNVLDKYSNYI